MDNLMQMFFIIIYLAFFFLLKMLWISKRTLLQLQPFSPAVCCCKIGKFLALSRKMSPSGNKKHKSRYMSGTNVPTVSYQLEFFTTWKESYGSIDDFQPWSYC